LYVASVLNCTVCPVAIADGGFGEVTVIDVSTGASTVRVMGGDVNPPRVAVIPDEPGVSPVTRPGVVLVKLATAGAAATQVTMEVKSADVESE